MQLSNYKRSVVAGLVCGLVFMSGCQKQNSEQESSKTASVATTVLPAVSAKTVDVQLPQKIYCESDECTAYTIQTVQTNQPWIDEYFLQRLKKDAPLAFAQSPHVAAKDLDERDVSKSNYSVSFLSQNYHLLTFVLESDSYAAGAAHGMYHREYVVFDLNTKKRVTMADLYAPEQQSKVYAALYQANEPWLKEHGIEAGKLEPTDNFYYGQNGIVFVYPLYELASYAEGMTELTLPYTDAKTLLHSQYLP
ncbi:RsiV family protein [Acinetobacter rathckeae]|uniref:RsiV family protein n=1 Tax=Acinetobacter rathckeae TaxID=2605272 RepID=UPI0018A29A8A|nr:RsiV family protein [Acinetobacter rathckeae]MBF7686838.1 DUF3298 domain-containing protein [Acinetobacter rathckeae]MBF7695630.1 DUF3298 domain-containing protein [Acinetobacter rathckeae]